MSEGSSEDGVPTQSAQPSTEPRAKSSWHGNLLWALIGAVIGTVISVLVSLLILDPVERKSDISRTASQFVVDGVRSNLAHCFGISARTMELYEDARRAFLRGDWGEAVELGEAANAAGEVECLTWEGTPIPEPLP